MNILVTGGSGFIGSNFISYWLNKNPKDKITNLDLLTYYSNGYSTAHLKENKNYKFIKGNILNETLVDQLTISVDLIVHFAAESHVDKSIQNPEVFFSTNIMGTHNLLKYAVKNNVKKFHHVSTDEVFGDLGLDNNRKFTENSSYNPRTPYSASKAASDHIVRSYFYTYGLDITISNSANNYGPFQNPASFIPRAITNLMLNKPIPIYGDGKSKRDWVHVLDHCRAIDLIVNKGKPGETYLIGGNDQNYTNLDIANMIINEMKVDKKPIKFVKDRGHDKRYTVNWNKLKSELGWKPQYRLATEMPNLINWYKQNPKFWEKTKEEFENFYKTL